MIDVKFYEVFEEEEREIKRFLPKGIRAQFTPKTVQEDGKKRPPAELISIRTQSEVPLEWTGGIKGILARSQGYDRLLAFQRELSNDIAYGYLGNYCARAVAEQAILVMMALMRKLKKQTQQFDSFARDGLTGKECKGRHVLVIGVGNIGSEIVDIAKGLNMHVRGVDIAPTLRSIDYVSLSEGLAWAEVVFCALPLTKQTEGMLDRAAFQEAEPGLIFINIGRGEISPMADLKELLGGGVLAGIGLDVYPQEGVMADSLRAGQGDKTPEGRIILKLARDERVIFTPHNAFNTTEALEQKASLTAAAVVSYLKNKTFPFPAPTA